MRVMSCMLVLTLMCLTGTGCSLFKKNTNSGGSGGLQGGGPAPPKFPDPLLNSNINSIPTPPSLPPAPANPGAANPAPVTPTSLGNSTLAGTVIDAYYRPVPGAYIRWVNIEEKEGGAPIDVAANASGHFIIQGLKTGTAYKLIARTKQGEKMLAGTVLTTAPNTRVAIMIREDLVNSSTPPLPSAPVPPAQGPIGKNDGNATKPAGKGLWDPLFGFGKKQPAAEPNLPATLNVPAPPANTPVGKTPAPTGPPTFVPNISDLAKDRPPLLSVPNKPALPTPTPGSKLDTGPTRVPSCVLVGNHLENFALKDTKGQTWEYKKSGSGKLVLLDFWGTYCHYCRDSMPVLNRFQQQYGNRGLEVIGIALEGGKDEKRDAEAVNKYCSAMQLSYRQLLGHVGSFDLGKHFQIQGVPTLILLSEQGDIIWQHTGRPDQALLSALERTIQNRLNNRPF